MLQRWLRIDAPNKDAAYGLILRNRSKQDDLFVKIKVQGLDAQGRSFVNDQQQVTVIPAGAKFVVDGSLIWGTSIQLRRIRVHLHVGRVEPRGRQLPRVLDASVVPTPPTTVGVLDATVSVGNPYKRLLPPSAKVYVAFLDSHGNVLDVGDAQTKVRMGRAETVSVAVPGDLSKVPPYPKASDVHSMLVTVDPCGIAAGSPSCPIPGAR